MTNAKTERDLCCSQTTRSTALARKITTKIFFVRSFLRSSSSPAFLSSLLSTVSELEVNSNSRLANRMRKEKSQPSFFLQREGKKKTASIGIVHAIPSSTLTQSKHFSCSFLKLNENSVGGLVRQLVWKAIY